MSEYKRPTADRMRDRKASIGVLPTVPAAGHMPFNGHRTCYDTTWRNRPKAEFTPRASRRKSLAAFGYSL